MSRFLGACLVALSAFTAVPAGGQPPGVVPPPAATMPELMTSLTVQPAPAPAPALKYTLLPELADQSPGNAVLRYYRAFSPGWPREPRGADRASFANWLTTPLKDLPRDKLAWLLDYGPLREIDAGARKETCDWDIAERLRKEGLELRLPDFVSYRELGTLLALRARLQMADGKFDDALYSLQSGLMLGRHIAEAPSLMCWLVGQGVMQTMLGQLEELVQMPGAPNLYWALSNLPSPMTDIRKTFQGERLLLLASLPETKDLEAERLTPEKEERLQASILKVLTWIGGGQGDHREELTLLALKVYPVAKEALVASGTKQAEVESWPVIQVVTLHSLREFRRLQDEVYKWLTLPYTEAALGVAAAERQIRQAQARADALPFFALLSAQGNALLTNARVERRIAALRCVEALRLYAAAHDGKLPASLDLLTEVPVPADPLTGKSFRYTSSGATFTLWGPPRQNEMPAIYNVINYQVTLRR